MNGIHFNVKRIIYGHERISAMMSYVTLVTNSSLKMAGSIEDTLNFMFSSHLSRADEDNISAMIEDYFCFDSSVDQESESNGKCVHSQ